MTPSSAGRKEYLSRTLPVLAVLVADEGARSRWWSGSQEPSDVMAVIRIDKQATSETDIGVDDDI